VIHNSPNLMLSYGFAIDSHAEHLQERLTREMTQREFIDLPFRFAEISKVLLDV
jgi:hypothetical protein